MCGIIQQSSAAHGKLREGGWLASFRADFFPGGVTVLTTKQKREGGSLKITTRSSHHGAAEMNQTGNHVVAGLVPGLAQWVRDLVLP